MEEMKHWDLLEKRRDLSKEDRALRDLAKQDFAKVATLKEIKWRQKAKVKWLKEGDSNRSFSIGLRRQEEM